MTFTVTYRDKNGAKAEVEIEAVSRTECVAACKARGIAPVGIKEGRSGAKRAANISVASRDCSDRARVRRHNNHDYDTQTKQRRASSLSALAVLGALATLALLIGGAWWWFSRETGDKAPTKAIRTAQNPKNKKLPMVTNVLQVVKKDVRDIDEKTNKEPQIRPAVKVVADTPPTTNKVVKMSPEDEAAFERVKRDTSLRTQVENRMALLATIKPGMPVPPMPPIPNLEQDFKKAEANVVKVMEGDSEADLMRKQFVIALKERISAAKKEGKTATEALNEYVAMMRQVADFRQKSLLTARQMEREGDMEGAKKLVESTNADLVELGAEPIDLHPAPKGKNKQSN